MGVELELPLKEGMTGEENSYRKKTAEQKFRLMKSREQYNFHCGSSIISTHGCELNSAKTIEAR